MTGLGLIYVIFLLPCIYVCSLFLIFEKTNRIYIAFMTRLMLFFMALLISCVAECRDFNIKGSVGSVADSMKVVICYDIDVPEYYGFNNMVLSKQPLAEALVKDGTFEVSGHVDGPARAYIIFCDARAASFFNDRDARYVTVMLDNADMGVAVDDVTRLPRVMNYDEPEVSPMMSETAAVISGGTEQNRYNEWRDAVMAAEDRLWHTESLIGATNHVVSNDAVERPQSELDSLKMIVSEQRKAVERINDDFINAHPEYAISLILQLKKLEYPYCYTKDMLESTADKFAGNADTLRYKRFLADMPRYMKFVKGRHFADLRMVSTSGEDVNLESVLSRDKVNIVDFWASWCGPCRAGMPMLRGIKDKYEGRINVIGVSLDDDGDKWLKALDDMMTWKQFRVRTENAGPVDSEYGVADIPSYFIISPTGEVIYKSSNIIEVGRKLESFMND